MIKRAQKDFERQHCGAVYLQLLFLAALLHLIIKLCATKLVPLRHLHMEYYSGAFPDASEPFRKPNWKKPKMFSRGELEGSFQQHSTGRGRSNLQTQELSWLALVLPSSFPRLICGLHFPGSVSVQSGGSRGP